MFIFIEIIFNNIYEWSILPGEDLREGVRGGAAAHSNLYMFDDFLNPISRSVAIFHTIGVPSPIRYVFLFFFFDSRLTTAIFYWAFS